MCMRPKDFTAKDKPSTMSSRDWRLSSTYGYYTNATAYRGRAGCNKLCLALKDCKHFAYVSYFCFPSKAKTMTECKPSRTRNPEYKIWKV
jgi:hypothetical protein